MGIPQDGAYNQTRPIEILKSKAGCADMQAATDRFPLILQEKMLDSLLTPSVGNIWRGAVEFRYF